MNYQSFNSGDAAETRKWICDLLQKGRARGSLNSREKTMEALSANATAIVDGFSFSACDFIPDSVLNDIFNKDEHVRRLIDGVDNVRYFKDIIQVVRTDYKKVCCILFLTGQQNLLSKALKYRHLCDARLPFEVQPFQLFGSNPHDLGWKAFDCVQRMFCVPELITDFEGVEFDEQSILPFEYVQENGVPKILGTGSTATIYCVKVHPDYDKFESNSNVLSNSNHTFAVKEYQISHSREGIDKPEHRENEDVGDDGRDYCKRECSVFQALNVNTHPNYIIDFYGCVFHGETPRIFLELATCNLSEYTSRVRKNPPSTPLDAWFFWNSLLRVIRGLEVLHSKQIFHIDIRPSNILIVIPEKPESDYEFYAKIADFTHSHIREISTKAEEELLKSIGNRKYGDPEKYSVTYGEGNVSDLVPTRLNSDCWSFACVVLECATWISEGDDGVKEFWKRRKAELERIADFHETDCFHNGFTALDEVVSHLGRLIREYKDITTCQVLLLLHWLFVVQERRLESRVWWKHTYCALMYCQLKIQHLHRVVDRACNAMKQVSPDENFTPTLLFQDEKKIVDDIISHSASQRPQLWHLNATENPGMAKIPAIDKSPILSSDNQLVLQRDGGEGQLLEGHIHGNSGSSSARRQLSWDEHLQNGAMTVPDLTTEPGELLGTPLRQGRPNRLSRHACSAPPLILQDTEGSPSSASPLPLHESMTPVSDGMPPLQTPERLPDDVFSGRRERRSRRSSKSPPEKPPCWPLCEGLKELARREGGSLRGKRWKELEPYSNELKGHDIVFLVDDTASMREHWSEVERAVYFLAKLLKTFDDNGMDLHFSSGRKPKTKERSSKAIRAEVANAKPEEDAKPTRTNFYSPLNDILAPLRLDFERPISSRSNSTSLKVRPWSTASGVKKTIVYVFTDAFWQRESNVEKPISEVMHSLIEYRKGLDYFGIQFIQFGDDAQGSKILRMLDDGLVQQDSQGDDRDVVDTVKWHEDTNLLKIILGPVNRSFDGKGPPIESNSPSPARTPTAGPSNL